MTRAILRRNVLYKERGMDKHDLKKDGKIILGSKRNRKFLEYS